MCYMKGRKMNNYLVRTEFLASWNEAMKSDNLRNIRKVTDRLIHITLDGILNQQYVQLHELVGNNAKRLEAWRNSLKIDSNLEYQKIYAYTTFMLTANITDKLYREYQDLISTRELEVELKKLGKSVYIYPMLELLARNGEVSQGEIAKYLKISSNSLSNLIRRNEKYGLWNHQKYGKYKYYFLSAQGRRCVEAYHKKQIEASPDDLHSVFAVFLDSILLESNEDIPNSENVLHRINEKIGRSHSIVGNELEKVLIRRILRKMERQERTRELLFSAHRYHRNDVYDLGEKEYHIQDMEWKKYYNA